MERCISIEEKALIKAAKLICNLKSGVCPMYEPDFLGCPHTCNEDIRPWQCWVSYLTTLVSNKGRVQTKSPLRRAA
ncbi:MAG: hypothetical protein KKD01_07760 [Proteobacteria bacterium]|nr:hypothetical protein [Pseudomonadota bacterium]MBU1234332.1 hypothetical protein [Pseudomonadota bacterium]MBU1420696.1 hypothetical protein [Pseudomonadota bacterium]MBU1454613.1 hypothetical protein [Pseudomonadota bacterium]